MWLLLGLTAGTFVSEDAALVSAAALAKTEVLTPFAAGAAVALGIWVGDLGLFLAGRLTGRWAPVARWVERRWPPSELQALASRLNRRAAWAILVSRVVPGSRVPLYVAAGALRMRLSVFALCTFAAVGAWTAAIVLGAMWLP